ncbi:MAG: MBL fold metallo-hydrolase, partial [Candidatus Thiodiazotropha endolucinida]|nr:MBL fold metallo-hydrolase [Candidatus Thiodiazotropha taylori]MCW4348731.1 MBL fold metallo-hydrolase [Candidatus Thiodiazotropha endolucinida]
MTQEILSLQVIQCLLVVTAGVVLFLSMDGLQARTLDAREIAPGIFVWPGIQEEFSTHNHGHIANTGFIVGSERVAVIDT